MFDRIKEFVKNNIVVQFLLVLVAGIAIGALFYPTKRIEERERQKHQEEIKVLKEQYEKELASSHEMYAELNASSQKYHEESEKKITKLSSEVHTLKSKQKTAYYKIVKPDGTIEIKKFTESEVDESTKVIVQVQEEFKRKVDAIEQKWSDIHRERVEQIHREFASKEEQYQKKIDELEKSKVVEINKKSFGLEAGAMLNGSYYGHVTYDVFGPVFLGLHTSFGNTTGAGAGLGLRF